MCGIAGLLGLRDPDRVAVMTDALVHRGPDEGGAWDGPEASLGIRRLAIIDVEGGHQPLSDEAGRYVLVFNGEIYNYRQLRRELIDRGHRFATSTDAEVVVHLYEEKGADCVHQLRGMFAFCIWDRQERRGFLARDRMGIKPLYLVEGPGWLAFASELRALLAAGYAERRPDPTSVARYVGFPCVPEPETIVPGVRALLPGHRATFGEGRLQTERYWELRFPETPTVLDEAEAVARVRETLDEAIRLRMISDVPLGAFLSGGIDSSAVVGFMGQHSSTPVRTFSIVFTGDHPGFEAFDERSFAREVAERTGTEHTEILATGADVLEKLPRMIWATDQPSGDALQYYMVSEVARTGVTVALSGTGGDELFAGYEWFKEMRRLEEVTRKILLLPGPARRSLERFLAALPPALAKRGPVRSLRTLLRGADDPVERYRLNRRLYRREERGGLLHPEIMRQARPDPDEIDAFAEGARGLDPISLVSYLQLNTDLINLLIRDSDAVSMAHSLEVRLPLVDHELVELVAAMPPELKLRGDTEKYLLRQASSEVLPPGVASRGKQGFIFPMHLWMERELRPVVRQALAPERVERRGLFRSEAVAQLLASFERGREPFFKIWNLVSLELWCTLHLDHGLVGPPEVPLGDLL